MGNFSLLVNKKYNDLSTEQKQIFKDEFERRKKSVGVAYLLWFFLGWHYAYVKKWGLLLLYILSLGGFIIWAIVDLFRIPKLISDYNNNLAIEILRDITLMFGKNGNSEFNNSPTKLGSNVNTPYFSSNKKSDGSYIPIVLLALFVVFIGVSAFFKPDRIKIENQIVDRMLEHNPDMVIMMKNLFFGKEMKEEYVDNFIKNTLNKEGYSNITFYEKDWIVLRKIEYVDVESNVKLINAYGFFGKTFIVLNFENKNLTQNNISNDVESYDNNQNGEVENHIIKPKINKTQYVEDQSKYVPIPMEKNYEDENTTDKNEEKIKSDSLR